MVTVIYTKPHKFRENLWLIGWSKTTFEKVRCNLFHEGTYDEAVVKIASIPGKKYLKRPA